MSLLVILSTYAMEEGQTATSVPHHHTLVLGVISNYTALVASDLINVVHMLHVVEEYVQLAFIVKGF